MNKLIAISILFTAILLCHVNSNAQSWTWDSQTSVANGIRKVTKDLTGNLYLYDVTSWNSSTNPPDTIKRITPTGQLLSQMVLPLHVDLLRLVNAPDSGLYLSGIFGTTISINNATYSATGMDSWVARYNKAGGLVWFKTIQGKGTDMMVDICSNGAGLVMTGVLEDTVNFLGQIIPKPNSMDLFVSTISDLGILQNIKLAVQTPVPNFQTYSSAGECEVDAAGNIYVIATGVGTFKIDTFTVSKFSLAFTSTYSSVRHNLIKFNSSLQPLRVNIIKECFMYCFYYHNLRVTPLGDSYFAQDYFFAQSGADDSWTTIYKINSAGTAAANFQLKKGHRNSNLPSMELDQCGNLYFTGYWRNVVTNPYNPMIYSPVVGQLSSSLTLNWLWQDSIYSTYRSGNALAVLGMNDLFVNGIYQNNIQLLNTITSGTNIGAFFGRFTAPGAVNCNTSTTIGLVEQERNHLSIYPNPTDGLITLEGSDGLLDVTIYSIEGKALQTMTTVNGVLDLSELQEGIYFLRIPDGSGGTQVLKVVLTH